MRRLPKIPIALFDLPHVMPRRCIVQLYESVREFTESILYISYV